MGVETVRWRHAAGWAAVGLTCVAAYGQLRDKPASAGLASFRVTNWPEHSGADQSYAEEVENYLNKMAAEGWRFHSDLVGQFGKMMVFERASRP